MEYFVLVYCVALIIYTNDIYAIVNVTETKIILAQVFS